jgi:hypothetical protein
VPSTYSVCLVNVERSAGLIDDGRMIMLILIGLLCGVRTQRSLVLENLALRHQLVVLQRTVPRPRLRTADRPLWVLLSRLWPAGSVWDNNSTDVAIGAKSSMVEPVLHRISPRVSDCGVAPSS